MAHKEYIKAFIPPLIVLIIHFIIFSFKTYTLIPWIDIPMHIVGGSAISFTFYNLLEIARNKKLIIVIHKLIHFIFVIALVALAAIFWEFGEYIIDITLNLNFQEGIVDTMSDLLFGLLGGSITYFIIQKNQNKN